MAVHMKRGDLFEVLQECRGGRQEQKRHLEAVVLQTVVGEITDKDIKTVKQEIGKFCYQAFKKLDQCGRSVQRFYKNNVLWLNSKTVLLKKKEVLTSPQGGRPPVDFHDSSDRSKRRKTETLRASTSSSEQLAYAASMQSRSEGSLQKANLLKEIDTTPTRHRKISKAWRDAQRTTNYSNEEALALFLETNLTRHQYQLLRNSSKSIGHDIYPSYHKIVDEKKKCYPNGIQITESVAEVPMQELLNHTAQRLAEAQKDVILSTSSLTFYLLIKWGCDGSSGHSEYKQVADAEEFTDSNIFLTSLVPIQLYSDTPQKQIIWQNKKPSSTMFCRPVKIQFKKETDELASNEVDVIEQQISKLNSTKINLGSREVEVHHRLQLTMIDGKICNALTSTASAQTCYVCKATPKDMNRLSKKKHVDTSTFKFGLSTLHAWIRFFEWLLHVAYRLEIRTWQVRGNDSKQQLEARKREIQKKLKTEMGLIVDQPKPGGSGTSNDGNTARRFFQDPLKSATITGLDVRLISKCAVILQTLSCGFEINTSEFEKWCNETAELYVSLYPWYYMPASAHKILMHGPAIISAALLPIGQMSEEAQEARNKHLRTYREHHSRKSSREHTISDVFHRLLATSDPLISTLRQPFTTKSKRKPLPAEVLNLLKEPETPSTDLHEDTDSGSDADSN